MVTDRRGYNAQFSVKCQNTLPFQLSHVSVQDTIIHVMTHQSEIRYWIVDGPFLNFFSNWFFSSVFLSVKHTDQQPQHAPDPVPPDSSQLLIHVFTASSSVITWTVPDSAVVKSSALRNSGSGVRIRLSYRCLRDLLHISGTIISQVWSVPRLINSAQQQQQQQL